MGPSRRDSHGGGLVRYIWRCVQEGIALGHFRNSGDRSEGYGSYSECFRGPSLLPCFLVLEVDISHSQTTYHVHWVAKGSIESEVGRGLLSADGDAHKRQRKSINPGFTSVKIREYSKIFTDCAHKV
jgi:hypothetical protein